MQEYFEGVLSLTSEEQMVEQTDKGLQVDLWLDMRIDLRPFNLSSVHFESCLRRLKGGKGSPDGLTAEIYKALPGHVKESLRAFLQRAFWSLDLPAIWFQSTAALIPKNI